MTKLNEWTKIILQADERRSKRLKDKEKKKKVSKLNK